MLNIVYIGKPNQTNSFICEVIRSNYSTEITFHQPDKLLEEPEALNDEGIDLAILDLNSSYGIGSAPSIIAKINTQLKTSPLLVLYPSNYNFITPLVEAGADGVISNTPMETVIIKSIDRLLNGEQFISNPN
ncbi:MAG TPA: hypothetical protein VJ941_02565 [Gracilimonas sp.]|nr:hypothetical protein [Gracilimonas sp.]